MKLKLKLTPAKQEEFKRDLILALIASGHFNKESVSRYTGRAIAYIDELELKDEAQRLLIFFTA